MNVKKKLLATAVGASLVFGAGAANASFDQDHQTILFPYVVKDTNRTTVITIIGDGGQPQAGGTSLHLQYWTKSTTAANTAACEPSSITVAMTENDIVTFDTAGLLGYPLFGDTTNPAPLGTSISYAAPRHGYLLVESTSGDGLEYGYWLEIDLANGGAHGDIGFAGNSGSPYDFDGQLVEANMLRGDDVPAPGNGIFYAAAVNFWPASIASTAFTVTPLGEDMLTRENNVGVFQVFNSNQQQGAYDRNENGIDGTVPQTVRCVGRLTAAQLMPGVVANAAWAATGGWGWLSNLGNGNTTSGETGATGDLDAIVYQVDTSNAAGSGKFMQNATRIVSDNE